MRHTSLLTAAVLIASASPAFAQLRVCTWNVTNYGSSDFDRNPAFQTAFYGVIPAGLALAGKSMSPDVVIGQEFNDAGGVTNFRNMLNAGYLAATGQPGDWVAAPFVNGADTDNAFFYRSSKVQFLGGFTIAVGSSAPTNQPRDTRRYDFRPVGYASAPATIGAYSIHLKAQESGGGDDARRLIECQRIRDNAEGTDTNGAGTGLPAGYAFLLAGDTNITSAFATEYVELVGSQANNTGRFFDPINSPGNWQDNATFRYIFTQDPTGNMDDRFDIILISAALRDGAALDYLGNSALSYSTSTWNDPNHSYRCWGSDGAAQGTALRTVGNTFVGQTIAQALIDTAENGGHLPIIADFRVPAKFTSSAALVAFGTVEEDTPASATFTITNSADVAKWTASGISPLRYTMTVTGPFTLTGAGVQQTEPADAAAVGLTHTVTMDTSTPGPKTGSITFTTDAPDTTSFTIALSGTVTTPPPPCAADIGVQGGLPGHDGLLDNNDFIAFIDYFFASNPVADMGVQGGLAGSDGQYDNNDFIAFINAFFAGCPG
jgi:hypothetical protein